MQQIAHGGLLGYNPKVNYLVVKVSPQKIELELKELAIVCKGPRLWQEGRNRPHESVTISEGKIQYSVAEKTITSLGKKAPLAVKDGRVKLELLVDRTSIELFGNAGRIQMVTCFLPDVANRNIGVFAEGGEAKIVSLKVYELKSAWTE